MDVIQTNRLIFPPDPSEASKAIFYLADELKSFNTMISLTNSPFNLLHFRLALDEAVLNALEHGCKGGQKEDIEIFTRFSPTLIEISVEDPGNGFHYDLRKIESPRDFEKMLNRGLNKAKGWGLAIIQSVTQGLSWNARGNRITMTFQR